MPGHSPHDPEHVSRTAHEELKKLGESESIFSGSIDGVTRRAVTHFGGRDDASDDGIEIWGKRIGRALSLIGVIALGVYLWATYLR